MGHSKETKRKISISTKGQHRSPSTEFKKGQHCSPATEFKKGQIPYTKLHPEVCQRGEEHYAWKGGKERFRCIDCNIVIKSIYAKRCVKCNAKSKVGKNHWRWKGKKVGYYALHAWITRRLGSPQRCDYCKTTKKRAYHWCNKSGKYKRQLNDWIRLCVPCHSKYDRNKIMIGEAT